MKQDITSPTLSLTEDEEWLFILKRDLHKAGREFLEAKLIVERERLVNGSFVTEELTSEGDKDFMAVTRPWCIAAVYGSNHVMELLYQNGADVTVLDEGKNVIHLLAERTCLEREMENHLLTTYEKMKEMLEPEELRSLLDQENCHGYTPIQWCLAQNAYGLYESILNTPGYCLVKEEHVGVMVRRWYDVTNFETNQYSMALQHILYGICFTHRETIANENSRKLFSSKFIRSYVNKKLRINAPILAAWFILHVLLAFVQVMYLACGPSILHKAFSSHTAQNSDVKPQPTCIGWLIPASIAKKLMNEYVIILLMIASFISVIFTISKFGWLFYKVSTNRLFDRSIFKKEFAAQYNTYNIFQALNNLFFLVIIVYDLVYFGTASNIFPGEFRHFLTVLLGSSTGINLTYFMILSNDFGWLFVTLNRLFLDMNPFMVIFVLYVPPSTVAVMSLSDAYSNQTTEFDNFWSATYTTFMAILGQADVSSLEPHKRFPVAFQNIQLVVAALMIINFMIAVFSNTVSVIMQNIEVLTTIQKLSLVHMAEGAFMTIPGLRKIHAHLVRRNFTNLNGKLCIQTATPR